MPTEPPRLTITATDDIAEAIDLAAERWPETPSRHELLVRLVERSRSVIAHERNEQIEHRREVIGRTSGALTGVYEPGYLERLRDDWPA